MEQTEPRKFYKTIVQVEILSEDYPVGENLSLEQIGYEITEGHCSGMVFVKKEQELTPRQAAKALLRQGSDPEFFRLDEKGNEVE